MTNSERRSKYRNIRYEYYHCGRSLMFEGNFLAGGIMLGYAVETTLKAGLLEVLNKEEQKKDKILRKSHDIVKILNECRKYRIFMEIEVSRDFLEHINNNFQRYPSQMYEIFIKASERNIVLGNSPDNVYYYDDLIVQLDTYLLEFTSDPAISMIYFAYRTLETKYAHDLLRKNAFALNLFNEFEQRVTKRLPSREDLKQIIIQNLSKGPAYYWNEGREMDSAIAKMKQISEQYKASRFKFHKWSEKSDVTI